MKIQHPYCPNCFRIPLLFAIILFQLSIQSCKIAGPKEISFDTIEQAFVTIPDSIQTSVYWYWLSDNISKEGVIKDLHAMKEVGINRAFIGNIGLSPNETSYGKVKIFSEEWWDIMHTALKTASELNIEIGIFNSPGWSQSGGPWVKPSQSMRYLASSETRVTGPKQVSLKLNQPADDFQDVKVLAFKLSDDYYKSFSDWNFEISSVPVIRNLHLLTDKDDSSGIDLPTQKELTIDFTVESPQKVRSIIIQPSIKPILIQAELFAKIGNDFKSVRKFEINRSNSMLVVGFKPYGPIAISIPPTTSSVFRIVFTNPNPAGGIAEIEFSSRPIIESYIEKTLAKMYQTPLPYWHEYMWEDQPVVDDTALLIQPGDVQDITQYLSADGILTWDVPEGSWTIQRTGMTPTGVVNEPASPEGTGLEADKMSREHIESHFDDFLGEIMRRIPPEDRKTWKVCVQDSYERGGTNWTDRFIEAFKERYKYDPVPFIPAYYGYVIGSQDQSDRFLWDVRRLVADKVAYDYVGGLRDICHKNGLTTWLENYGHWGFPGEFLQYGGQSDEVAGEFWSEGELGDIENRAASSCAHIYGKKKVSAESFTCGFKAYSRYPATMKKRGDRFFTEGINNTLLHVYVQQPYEDLVPGVNAFFGNEFNRNNTWFPYMDLFTQYLKRTNFMLQQGLYVADVAYFIGEDTPKMTGVRDPEIPRGYSYDYINAEVLLTRASVKDKKLVLPDGMSYRILVLPKLKTMRPDVLRKIKELMNAGLVVLGSAPDRSPSLENFPSADREIQQISTEIWGDLNGIEPLSKSFGKGLILSGFDMQKALDLIDIIPDCKLNESDSSLFIHRTLPDGEMYFISNQTDRTVSIKPQFRVKGMSPELWNPTSGKMRYLPDFEMSESATTIPLILEAYESQFIIFRKNASNSRNKEQKKNFPEPKVLLEVKSPWMVTFNHAMRGPKFPVVYNILEDWTFSDNDSIKYYSGTATYTTSIQLDQVPVGEKVFLHLGNLSAIAKIRINGADAGGVWTAPWQIEIGDFLRVGENVLNIEVANTWVNRLIGDASLPEKDRRTWSNQIPYTAHSPLQTSGLTGPVKIFSVTY